MPTISVPYDSHSTQLRNGRVHLARAIVRIANCPITTLYAAVDFDHGVFPFQHKILQDNLLPLLCRALQTKPAAVDLVVEQKTYAAVPSLCWAFS